MGAEIKGRGRPTRSLWPAGILMIDNDSATAAQRFATAPISYAGDPSRSISLRGANFSKSITF
jgi:hypothetical protein